MKSFARISLCLLGLVAVVFAALPLEDGVLVLDDTNWEEATSSHDLLLVEFYAPWYISNPISFYFWLSHG